MRAVRRPNEGEVTKRSSSTRRRPLGDITNTEALPLPPVRPTFSQPLPQCASTSDILITETTQDPEEEVVETIEVDRPYMNREVDDIDARDADNALLCSTYVDAMYESFWEIEAEFQVASDYLERQPYLNTKMRAVLIDWLVDVHLKFKMVPETLYLTVNIIDRYLEKHEVRKSKLQLVGVAAILLASKYEEIYPPEIQELVFITDNAYNAKEIIETEAVIMKALDYNLTVPTIHTFLCRYLKAAHADRTMVQMACYLAERSLQEYSSLKYPSSLIAAKAIHSARMSLRRHPWSPTLVHYTRYDEPDMEACGHDMREYLKAAVAAAANPSSSPGNSLQTAVARKYSGSKFGGVARMPITV
jgi:G2/mitotic-specific cyclin-B, other